jgi:hypothetical protein
VEFLDDFMVEGPNGTEVRGPTVAEDMEDIYGEGKYPIEIAKALVTQRNRDVANLHSCGDGPCLHGGTKIK